MSQGVQEDNLGREARYQFTSQATLPGYELSKRKRDKAVREMNSALNLGGKIIGKVDKEARAAAR